jgi:hypothetical protein
MKGGDDMDDDRFLKILDVVEIALYVIALFGGGAFGVWYFLTMACLLTT